MIRFFALWHLVWDIGGCRGIVRGKQPWKDSNPEGMDMQPGANSFISTKNPQPPLSIDSLVQHDHTVAQVIIALEPLDDLGQPCARGDIHRSTCRRAGGRDEHGST